MSKRLVFAVAALAAVVAVSGLALFLKGRICYLARRSESSSLHTLLSQAKGFADKNQLAAAQEAYRQLIEGYSGSPEVMHWQKNLEGLNIKLLFSPAQTPGSVSYTVRPGDTLTRIAKAHNTTVELIKKSNRIEDDRITPGRKIKIWARPFSIFIDKSQNTLMLKSGEEVFKTYTVSTGKNNSTPAGTYKITEKIINPPWFKPGAAAPIPAADPENILGTRWLGLNLPSYGIHGTTDPQSLGQQVTQGCVRMSNSDVEELYAIVPKGTEVTIWD